MDKKLQKILRNVIKKKTNYVMKPKKLEKRIQKYKDYTAKSVVKQNKEADQEA